MLRMLVAATLWALSSAPLGAQPAAPDERAAKPADPAWTRQQEDFRHIIKQRDEQVAARAEVQRIINFANGAANRVNRFLDGLPNGDFAGDLNRAVQAQLSNLDRFEAALAGAAEAEQRGGARTAKPRANGQPPPAGPAPVRANGREQLSAEQLKGVLAAFPGYDHGPMMNELRVSLSELRVNLSQQHLYWAAEFDGFLNAWEQQLRRASGAPAIETLRRALAGNGQAAPIEPDAAPDERVRSELARQREALRAAADSLRDRTSHAEVRRAMLADVKGFGQRIGGVGAAYDSDMQTVERNIVRSAKEVFGSDINSNVFLWLLGAFASIFLLVMVAPRFYAQTSVAENLLKAEFLLQFSTVFILTAAIIILGIGGFIERDQLPVLLAGISGYVLGQLGRTGGGDAGKGAGGGRAGGPGDAAAAGAAPGNDNRPAGGKPDAQSA